MILQSSLNFSQMVVGRHIDNEQVHYEIVK